MEVEDVEEVEVEVAAGFEVVVVLSPLSSRSSEEDESTAFEDTLIGEGENTCCFVSSAFSR